MKIITKKITVAVLAIIFVICSASLFGIFVRANAEETVPTVGRLVDGTFIMKDGVSLKLNEDGGLRFKVVMDEAVKKYVAGENTELGFVIAPTSFMEDAEKFAVEGNYLSMTKKLRIIVDKSKIYGDEKSFVANGCITNIYPQNRQLEFSAVAYILDKSTDTVQYAPFNLNARGNFYNVVNQAVLDVYAEDVMGLESYSSWYGTDEYPIDVTDTESYDALIDVVNSTNCLKDKTVRTPEGVTPTKEITNTEYSPIIKTEYTITFVKWSGETVTVKALEGQTPTAPANTEEDGYEFGWGEIVPASASVTYTETRKEATYKVTLSGTDGATGATLNSYVFGTGAVLPEIKKNGYIFDGWYRNQEFTGEKVTEISATETGDKTFYAKWSEDSHISLGSFEATECPTSSTNKQLKITNLSRVTESYLLKYNLRSEGLSASENTSGNVIYFNTYYNTDNSTEWKTNLGVMLRFNSSGLELYGWSNSGWVNRTVILTAEQKEMMGSADGLDLIFTYHDGEYALWLQASESHIEKVMFATTSATCYFVGSIADVYANNPTLTLTVDSENCKGQNAKESITDICENKYTRMTAMRKISEMAETNFESLTANRDFGEVTIDAPRPNKGYVARYTIKSASLAQSTATFGNVAYLNTFTNTTGEKWGSGDVNYGVMLMFGSNGLQLYGWSNSSWTQRTYVLTTAEKQLLATSGIDLIITHDGSLFDVYVERAEGSLVKVLSAPADGRYIVGLKNTAYSGNDFSAKTETYGFEGYEIKEAIGKIFDNEYGFFKLSSVGEAGPTEFPTASSNQPLEMVNSSHVSGSYLARFNIKSEGLSTSDSTSGNVIYFNTWTNTDNSNTWKTNFGVMLRFNSNGLELYGWSNSGWVNRTVILTAGQKEILGSVDGLDMFLAFEGNEFAVYLQTSENSVKKVMTATVTNTIYFVASKLDVYSNNPSITITAEAYNCNDETTADSIKTISAKKYQTIE